MCGLVAYFGNVDHDLVERLVYESGVRGLHHFGKAISPAEEAGIYHARYCTSGEVNQPLWHRNRALAFNGVINMGTKAEMEREYDLQLVTDNDGEVILQVAATPEAAVEFLRNPRVTFAGVWLEPGKLTAIRNAGRPLWILRTNEGVYLASTRDIFCRAGAEGEPEQLEPLKIYQWTF